jgi:hypothetical protein
MYAGRGFVRSVAAAIRAFTVASVVYTAKESTKLEGGLRCSAEKERNVASTEERD